MADDQRLLTDDRTDKRKCDDFAALYGLEGAAARALPDHSGQSERFASIVSVNRFKFVTDSHLSQLRQQRPRRKRHVPRVRTLDFTPMWIATFKLPSS
ncbi:hypothetical protein TNIN_475761 [Trichonephila inaurata madagascariensis]|uniref:Uncharacterized protein n=1 Tax=Trichonephila inaurata madagascariensis TaxID=2747483 RepID=A0A8X6ML39_9ARAC|nr:hypothetical protein TNIN_475761 [Trichonephila inaurata madagascariensis]